LLLRCESSLKKAKDSGVNPENNLAIGIPSVYWQCPWTIIGQSGLAVGGRQGWWRRLDITPPMAY